MADRPTTLLHRCPEYGIADLTDGPAGIALDSRTKSLLIANHAPFSMDPDHFAVLQVFVSDPGNALAAPCVP